MPRLVLVPLDSSPLAERALRYAVALVREPLDRLLLLRVLQPTPGRGMPLVQEPAARAELDKVAEQVRVEGLEVETLVSSTLRGDVARVIVEAAHERAADVIVMSTHGRGGLGRWVYGSVAEEVLRTSSIPVLVVPVTCGRPWTSDRPLRILVPLDGSTLAEQALEPIAASLGGIPGELVLLRVLPAPSAEAAAYLFEDRTAELAETRADLEGAADRLRTRGMEVSIQTAVGSAAEVIARIAQTQAIDLIAMATHGRSGLPRIVLGSVATETLQRATVPVLLVRPASLMPVGHAGGLLETATPERGKELLLLIALDLTDKADAAIAPAAKLARTRGGRVVLLNVFSPSVDMGHVVAPTQDERVEYVRAERRMYLDEKARAFEGIHVSTRVEVQAPGEEVDECIARVARELQADMLVIVSKRVSSAVGAVLGSFAQGVLRLSPCPVLVVRPLAAPVSEHALTARASVAVGGPPATRRSRPRRKPHR